MHVSFVSPTEKPSKRQRNTPEPAIGAGNGSAEAAAAPIIVSCGTERHDCVLVLAVFLRHVRGEVVYAVFTMYEQRKGGI